MSDKTHRPRICFVPGCKTGHSTDKNLKKQQGGTYPTLFRTPKDPKRLEQWRNSIPKADKVLSTNDVVCGVHFFEDDIMNFYETTLIDGTISKIKRGRPKLKDDATPCIFPNLPSYLSIAKRSQKPSFVRTDIRIEKNKQMPTTSITDEMFKLLKVNMDLISTPNEQWSGTFVPGKSDILFVEWDETYTPNKTIVIHQDMSYKVLFRKREIFLADKVKIVSFKKLENLMKSINCMPIRTETKLGGMDEKQQQDPLDPLQVPIKTEPVDVLDQTEQSQQTIINNDFESEIMEQYIQDEMKEEMIECELPEIELHSVFPTTIDQYICDKMQFCSKTIKRELEDHNYTTTTEINDIKQEVNDLNVYIQENTDSRCNLEVESTQDYLEQQYQYSRKLFENTGNSVIEKKRRRYECPVCQNSFHSSRSRSTHISGHFKNSHEVCQFCGKLMTKSEFFQHSFIHIVKYRTRDIINNEPAEYNLYSKELNQYSANSNNSEKLLKCDHCFKIFNKKSNLQRHVMIHNDEKPYKCGTCSKRFPHYYGLQQHLMLHSEEAPFKCDLCSKSFNVKTSLQSHLISHSGEKPFKCSLCLKAFSQKSYLQQHMIIHSGAKLFVCEICSKGFTHSSYLKQHLIVHNREKPKE